METRAPSDIRDKRLTRVDLSERDIALPPLASGWHENLHERIPKLHCLRKLQFFGNICHQA